MTRSITFETPEGTSTETFEAVEYNQETRCWAVKFEEDAEGRTYIPDHRVFMITGVTQESEIASTVASLR